MTAFLSERGFQIGYLLMLLGVFLLLDGFAVDAYLHANDPDLAAEEGIFTLSNPGHLLVAIGLCTTLLGAAVGPYTRWVLPGRSPLLAMLAPAVAVGVALAISTAFAVEINDLSHEGDSHSHAEAVTTADDATATNEHPHDETTGAAAADVEDDAADGHTGHDLTSVLPEHRQTFTLVESTAHEPENPYGITAENLAFADQFLTDARAATEQYKDVSVAYADGYIQITPDLPIIGAHFFHQDHLGLDPAKPSNLLYTHADDNSWRLAGMAYALPKTVGDDVPPDTELGGLASWHYHSDLCFMVGAIVTIAESAVDCLGFYVEETGWLLHVWAWLDSPEGVFDHANSLLQ